ncbi:N-acetylneuraminate epimerase [Planctomycetales bacterium 10988]|nr:N-acetylneuraminate epimerase [Planctomycetales bacterium 10988]
MLRSLLLMACFLSLFQIVSAEPPDGEQAAATVTSSKEQPVPPVMLHQPLPESVTSFSAAVVGDYLYIFSGHSGVEHGFGTDLLINHFRRIRFDDPSAEWEELAMHPPAQSTALVSDGTYLYRVGGLSFINGEDADSTEFNSTDYFARYDIERDEWTDLEPLPKPRSSLDAAILDRSVYVAGGWNLQGESSSDDPWHETILRFDLDQPEQGWQELPGPGYLTRAISVAAHDGRLFVLGGIQQRSMTRKVSIYDPKTEEWSEGPELRADSSLAGFATSSFATGGHLYYTGSSGIVYRLNELENTWEVASRLMFPRMFLRLLPLEENRLVALGGTSMLGGRSAVVESLRVDEAASSEPHTIAWSVPFDGRAEQGQSLVLDGTKLYAFGGNASRQPHDFSKEAFVNEAFVFDIAAHSVEKLPSMPRAMQNGNAVLKSITSEHEAIILAGGLGYKSDHFGSLKQVFLFNPESQSWQKSPVRLPEPRAMSSAVVHDDAVWFFGGSDAGHGQGLSETVLHWWGDDSDITPLPDVTVPTPRRSFGGGVLNDEYYMVGGLTGQSGIAETVDVFNFNDRTWRTAASPTEARVFPSLVVSDEVLYLFGGFTRTKDGHFAPATSLERYDSETDKWTTVSQNLPAEIDSSMAMLNMGGRLLFYGIDRHAEGVANFVLYDPSPQAEPEVVSAMSFSRSTDSSEEVDQNTKVIMRKDANKDGQVSRNELGNRMTAFFESADSNSDQMLSYTEVKEAFERQAEIEEKDENEESSE